MAPNAQQMAIAMMIAQAQNTNQVNSHVNPASSINGAYPSHVSGMPTHHAQQQVEGTFGMLQHLDRNGHVHHGADQSFDSSINSSYPTSLNGTPPPPVLQETKGLGSDGGNNSDTEKAPPTRKRKERPQTDDADNRRMHCWNCSPDCPNLNAGPARHHVAGMCGRCHQKWQKHPDARWAVLKCVSKCRCARCEVSRNPTKSPDRRPHGTAGSFAFWVDEEGLAQAAALAAATKAWASVIEPLFKEGSGGSGHGSGESKSLVHSLVHKLTAQLADGGASDDGTMLTISSLVGRPCVVGHRMPEGITHFGVTSDPLNWPLALKVRSSEGMPGTVMECNPAAALALVGGASSRKGLAAAAAAAAAARGEVIGQRFEGVVALKSLPFAVAACVQCHLTGVPQALAAVHLKKDSAAAPMGRQMLVLPATEKDKNDAAEGLQSRFVFPSAEWADGSGFLVVFGPPAQASPDSSGSGGEARATSPAAAAPAAAAVDAVLKTLPEGIDEKCKVVSKV